MIISRKNMVPICKYRFCNKMFVRYSDEQISYIAGALKKVITDYPISTIGCITYLRKHYNGNLELAMSEVTECEMNQIRFNCVYQSKVLHELLLKRGINSYYVSYRTINYTTPKADKQFVESHTSIFVPTIISNKKCFIVLEPGLKVDIPIYLFGNNYHKKHGKLDIIVGETNNKKYPLYLLLDGVNKYSYNLKPHKVYQEFNPNYYITNPMNLIMPYSYKHLSGYRATTFSTNRRARASITIFPVKEKITIYDGVKDEIIDYAYDVITEELLRKKLPRLCKILKLDLEETIENILFMKTVKDEFIQMMDKDTVMYLRKGLK